MLLFIQWSFKMLRHIHWTMHINVYSSKFVKGLNKMDDFIFGVTMKIDV